MRKGRGGIRFGILYGVILAGFTAYSLLDVFVIPHSYTVVENATTKSTDSLVGTSEGSGTTGEGQNFGEDGQSTPDSTDSGQADGAVSGQTDEGQSSGNTATEESTADSGAAGGQTVDSGADSDQASNSGATGEVVSTDTAYSDDNIKITLTEYRENDTTIYVADVQVSSAEYLKTALADNTYGRNIKENTSEIASSNNAILAINGDFYGSQNEGYVIRNGVLYRSDGDSDNEDLVILEDGSFRFIQEGEVSAEELLAQGARQVLSFGPALVKDGAISVTADQEVGKAMASNPRTAIGIIDDLHYVFVVSDGRTSESEGLSLHELAEFMQELGVSSAYNLDGGGSSTMYFNGQVVNNPTTHGNRVKERSVSDIVYIGY